MNIFKKIIYEIMKATMWLLVGAIGYSALMAYNEDENPGFSSKLFKLILGKEDE